MQEIVNKLALKHAKTIFPDNSLLGFAHLYNVFYQSIPLSTWLRWEGKHADLIQSACINKKASNQNYCLEFIAERVKRFPHRLLKDEPDGHYLVASFVLAYLKWRFLVHRDTLCIWLRKSGQLYQDLAVVESLQTFAQALLTAHREIDLLMQNWLTHLSLLEQSDNNAP